jgi:hypothetical protein
LVSGASRMYISRVFPVWPKPRYRIGGFDAFSGLQFQRGFCMASVPGPGGMHGSIFLFDASAALSYDVCTLEKGNLWQVLYPETRTGE